MPHHGLRVFPSLSQPSPCSELMLNSATQQVMANCSKTAVLELGRGWMAHKRGFCLILLAAFYFILFFFVPRGHYTAPSAEMGTEQNQEEETRKSYNSEMFKKTPPPAHSPQGSPRWCRIWDNFSLPVLLYQESPAGSKQGSCF